ncbi:MAG TPA: pectinesterase family protein, partial [Tepidisphaeraceae bacterium]|nr:pectinesterase family protein [Tepidisphaeraceae bacterium]
MKTSKSYLLLIAALLAFASFSRAQDNVSGGKEPIDNSIDPSKLVYDYLVDGDLPSDDPAAKKFKTLQAAYEAAAEGTEQRPTVIGIKPNVYQLPGGARTPSMSITKNWITFLGLTNNRRSVVLADNRGHMEGADDDGYILDVNATGFTAKNLTILNYTNCDYEYPGDPSKSLKMRNPTITQAVSLQAQGDKHVYENIALCSRLDTMFLRTARSYFKNVFIEGTDDFIGGGNVSYWENCKVIFPTGSGVMSAGGVVFKNTTFESTEGMQFSKGPGRPDALIDCVLPVSSARNPVAWIRGKVPPRPTQYYLTYHCKDAAGNPAVIRDGSAANAGSAYGRELSDREALAFNPWNLLRGADDWDPTGSKANFAEQRSQIYRMILNPASSNVRTNGNGTTIRAMVLPANAADKTVKWSTHSDLISLDQTTGPAVNVMGKNNTSSAQWVAVTATGANGFNVNAYVYVEPPYTDPPAITAGPTLNAPAHGSIDVGYTLDLTGHEDQSLISWFISDDASGANARDIAVSRGDRPLKELPLTLGYVGKYIKATLEPKHQLSDAGAAKSVVAKSPIAASDVITTTVNPDFRNFVETPNSSYVSGLWTVNGTWTIQAGDLYENGYGIRVGSQGASLLYQQDADCGDMQIELVMTPEKTAGMVFGSPGASTDGDRVQKMDVYIKYDPRTKNGYALRFWRTTQSAEKCMYQL